MNPKPSDRDALTVAGARGVRADRRGVESRRRIIEAAIDVFGQRGFRTASLQDVAEQVSVTPAGILYHFGSKAELLLAVIRERDRRQAPILEELGRKEGWESFSGAVRFAEIGEQEPNLMALHTVLEIESLDPDSPAHEYFKARNQFLLGATEATLKGLQRTGEIRDDVDCARVARQILAFEHGAAVLWLKNPEISLVELYQDYFDSLIHNLTSDRHASPA